MFWHIVHILNVVFAISFPFVARWHFKEGRNGDGWFAIFAAVINLIAVISVLSSFDDPAGAIAAIAIGTMFGISCFLSLWTLLKNIWER